MEHFLSAFRSNVRMRILGSCGIHCSNEFFPNGFPGTGLHSSRGAKLLFSQKPFHKVHFQGGDAVHAGVLGRAKQFYEPSGGDECVPVLAYCPAPCQAAGWQ